MNNIEIIFKKSVSVSKINMIFIMIIDNNSNELLGYGPAKLINIAEWEIRNEWELSNNIPPFITTSADIYKILLERKYIVQKSVNTFTLLPKALLQLL